MAMITVNVMTNRRKEMLDITGVVRKAVAESGIKDGLCVAFVPHTTAGITINENADPDVVRDLIAQLEKMVPARRDFHHTEGNSDAHIQASLMGSSIAVIVEKGKLALGTWQGIYFCEFDGPRTRKLLIEVARSK